MRFYVRTSRNTGVSLGPIGLAVVGLGWLCIFGLVLEAVLTVFRAIF